MPKNPTPNRRDFLRSAAAAAAGIAISSRFSGTLAYAQALQRRSLAPVRVARERVIREVVGLRPYRDEGYVVEAVNTGDKLLIHHYGHGGAGITMSWGTAAEAVELARGYQPKAPKIPRGRRSASLAPAPRRYAVIGCGVVGLSTAITLQRRFQDGPGTVTIYAKDLPPDTTSNIAGGFWSPTSAYDSAATDQKFRQSFRAAARASNRAFQLLVGEHYGVRWIDTYNLHRGEGALENELPGGDDLYPQRVVHRDPANYFGFPVVRQYSTMLIEPSVYLAALLRDFYAAGGKLVVREFRSREEIMQLAEPIVFNCSGLGARALFGDEKLTAARGQLEILLPQSEVDYCYLGPGYMFPRRDGIVLGGTFERDDWSLEVRRGTADEILNTHANIMRGR